MDRFLEEILKFIMTSTPITALYPILAIEEINKHERNWSRIVFIMLIFDFEGKDETTIVIVFKRVRHD